MTPIRKTDTFSLRGTDSVLLLVGVLGIAAFMLMMPRLHPDSAAVYTLTEEEAIDRANVFLASQGYSVDGLKPSAMLMRNTDLLEQVQRVLGRSDAAEFLASSAAASIPAYYWNLTYRTRDPSAGPDETFAGLYTVFHVDLNLDGAVVGFRNESGTIGSGRMFGSAQFTVNRSALAVMVAADSGDVSTTRSRLASVPDSTLLGHMRFDFSRQLDERSPEMRLQSLEARQMVLLDSTDVRTLLSHHFDRTGLRDVSWRTDSLRTLASADGRIAEVTLVSDPPIAGQTIVAQATVTSAGNLARVDLQFNPGMSNEFGTLASVMQFITVGAWILLVVIFIVVFFRRLMSRLVDVKSAMIDAVIVGILIGGVAVMGSNERFVGFDWPLWADILVRVVLFSVVAGGISLFVFMVSGVTDSLSRDRFPEKLRTLVLFRHGDLQNVPFGTTVIRGLLGGFGLLGVAALSMYLFDALQPHVEEMMVTNTFARPVLGVVMAGFAMSWLATVTLAMSFGVLAHRICNKAWCVIPMVTLGAIILDASPIDFHMTAEGLAASAGFGLLIGLLFHRYDLMTMLVALFTSHLLWQLKEGYLVGGVDTWVDLLLASLLLTSVLVFAFIALLGGRSGRDLKEYVPEYVTEMASQERVKREVEIAYQVQANFLPRTMPRIAGLDIAGMCLPANEVGGDYYDFIELDDQRVAFVVGDVSGKGIHASFYMTLVKGILQTLSRLGLPAAEVMRRLNHLFCINVPSGTFISMIYGILDVQSGEFSFARAGHNPAILRRASENSYKFLRPAGMAIGFSDGKVFDNGIEEMTVVLQPGDALVLYTDGFSEAMNSRRDLYGDERLADKVAQVGSKSASAILRLLTEDVHHFIEGMGRSDDMTMVVVKRKAES
jgi:hypothetical protein